MNGVDRAKLGALRHRFGVRDSMSSGRLLVERATREVVTLFSMNLLRGDRSSGRSRACRRISLTCSGAPSI